MAKKKQTRKSSHYRRDTAPKPKPVDNTDRPVLRVPVSFTGVGVGKKTSAIGIKIDRAKISMSQLDAFFIDCRADVTMAVDPSAGDDMPGQLKIIETSKTKLSNVADINRASVSKQDITARLSFRKEEIEDGELEPFAYQDGEIIIARVGSLAELKADEKSAAKGSDAGDDDDGQGTLGDE